MITSPATSGYILSSGQPAVVSTGHIRPGQGDLTSSIDHLGALEGGGSTFVPMCL